MNKNIPRIYMQDSFNINNIYVLSESNVHYIQKVLRMKIQDTLEIFNDTNYIFLAQIIYISKKKIEIKIIENKLKNIESPIHIHLGQVISTNEKMDFTIQKSTEMGINIVTPLFFKNSYFQKKNINISKKIQRWKKIAISACQQCNRNILPKIKNPTDIFSWCKNNKYNDIKIVFHPKSILTIHHLIKPIKYIRIIIGSERGFSADEIQKIIKYGFISMRLGPRILRTETASIAAITALQTKFGDF
ncbi:16S rRNA (uracil(1498)-N(3))-methyltransferase [Buchnera aphidicola (Acyrthosiphon lactucae)]|uniref:Ribosomal RNA small subunit methyltransferase E n=1 Tax=Buchnera aphidicola (Acyrthosiphon lactucae) TaxID=1241832 RepID=A0A4D6XTQ1_9GAMM|nr:16S rRNA (uracil(1498)-N(3))-methyltransferase [Buchnera aphidicola]QCI17800.1 16S rRNA (uracil(1498)-N(3))-methyltransferase [Buchnera aphidicola (Acyrthosiphon lactucae)]